MNSKLENVFEDIRILSPTHVAFTPRMYNILYSEFERLWQSKRAEYLESCHDGFDSNALNAIRDECKAEIREWLGTRLTSAIVGGAALNPKVKEFLVEVWGSSTVNEGYGTTESASIADDNGIFFPDVDWRIEDVPEMGYHKTDLPFPRGELLVKTVKTISSYVGGDEEANSSFSSDGYFRTGDIVELIGEKRIRLIDRRKAIFKLAQGEFVSPAHVEEALSASPLCKSVYITFSSVSAENNRVVAVVVPDEQLLRARLPSISKDVPFEVVCGNPEARACVLAETRDVGIKQGLRQFEFPVAVILDHSPWTVDNGMLTASLKINRPNVQRAYAKRVKALAAEIEEQVEQQPSVADKQKNDIAKTVSDILGISESDVGENIADTFVRHGGDSLSAIRLVAELKEKHNIDLSMRQLYVSSSTTGEQQAQTCQHYSLTGIYEPSIALASSSSSDKDQSSLVELVEQFKNDAMVDFDEKSWAYRCETKKSIDGDVFLTGCTGFLGIHVLDVFMRTNNRNKRKVYCLIRAENEDAAKKKLLKRAQDMLVPVFGRDGWANTEEALWKRVVVVNGDLEAPGLGLSDEARREVVMNAAVFIHVGSRVNHVLPYERLRQPNVFGTLAVAELAKQSNARVLCYVSTLSVMRGDNMYSFEQLTSTVGYVQSKAVAEHVIYNTSKNHNIPYTVVRPSMISWSSRTGAFNREDWLMRWILGCISVGCAPSAPRSMFLLVPVDFVAEEMLNLLKTDSSCGKSFNFDNITHPVASSTIFVNLSRCADKVSSKGELTADKQEFVRKASALGHVVHDSIWQDVVRLEQKKLFSASSSSVKPLRKEYVSSLSMFLNSPPVSGVITGMIFTPKDRPYPPVDCRYVATLFNALLQTMSSSL